jgi:hypothetical protein
MAGKKDMRAAGLNFSLSISARPFRQLYQLSPGSTRAESFKGKRCQFNSLRDSKGICGRIKAFAGASRYASAATALRAVRRSTISCRYRARHLVKRFFNRSSSAGATRPAATSLQRLPCVHEALINPHRAARLWVQARKLNPPYSPGRFLPRALIASSVL